MTEEVFNLDRANAEENRVDAFGKKWKVIVNKQNGLCHARPEPDRADAVIPDQMEGQWTKPSLLLKQIDDHVRKSWDMAEAAKAKARRKLAAEAEQAALEKRIEEEARAEAAEEARKASEAQSEESSDTDAQSESSEASKAPTKKKVARKKKAA